LEASERARKEQRMHEAEWAARVTSVSAMLYGGPRVMMLKAYGAFLEPGGRRTQDVCLTGHQLGFNNSCVDYVTPEWSRGVQGCWDGELEAAWGVGVVERLRSALRAWYETHPDGVAEYTDLGLEPPGFNAYVDADVFDTMLKRRLERRGRDEACEVLAWTPEGCVFKVTHGSVLASSARVLAAARALLLEGRLNAATIMPAGVEVRLTRAPCLVGHFLGGNVAGARRAWEALPANERKRVVREGVVTRGAFAKVEDYPIVDVDDLKRLGIRIDDVE
jgi:hypothetical protein